MRRSKRRVLPIACVDCGEVLTAGRRQHIRKDRTPITHFRCVPCEDRFLTVLDPKRLAIAALGIFRD